jgi:hypothetical protein
MAVDITTRSSESPDSAHSNSPPDSERRLRIYLSDHRAGAEAGRARAKRFAAANQTSFVSDAAHEVYREIEADVTTLDEILDRLGCQPSRWKMTVARTAEVIGRLKPNGQLRGYSPLSRLIELELLIAGILTKESLWQTMAVVQQWRSELSAFDFDDLQRRAMQQRMLLESHRAPTVDQALLR